MPLHGARLAVDSLNVQKLGSTSRMARAAPHVFVYSCCDAVRWRSAGRVFGWAWGLRLVLRGKRCMCMIVADVMYIYIYIHIYMYI